MNRLKRLLLAGAVVPALAFTPFADAFAQAPDDQPGKHGPRAGGPGGGGPGGGGPRMQREGGPGGEGGGARKQRGEGGPGGEGGAPRAQRGEGGPGGEGGGARRQRGEGGPGGEGGAPRAQRGEGGPGGEGGGARKQRGEGGPGGEGGGPRMQRGEGGPGEGGGGARRQRGEGGPGAERGPAAERGGPGAPPANAERAAPAGPGPGRAEGRPGRDRGPGAGRDADRMGGPGDERGPRGGPGERRGRPGDEAGPGAGPGGPGGRRDDRMRGDRGIGPGGAAAVGAGVAAGVAAGFMAGTGARRLDEIRRDRRETVIDGRTVIREPGREIVEDGGRRFVVHDENDRFRQLGFKVQRERRGADFVDIVDRPGGAQILTFTTPDGRLLRRVRRDRDGREIVLIDNGVDGRVRPVRDDIVVLPPPPMRIPRDRYIVDYEGAGAGVIYDTLIAPPVAPPPRRYTLDQIRYSPDIRSYVRAVDIDTINFDTGSWIVPGDQTGKLRALADAINKALDQNPNSVFLVEGYTDATGNPTDNLSLSDRRAQSVAAILTKDFNVPPENLTTQGYGDQNPKENTAGPSAANRRVVVQNITQLLASGGAPPQ